MNTVPTDAPPARLRRTVKIGKRIFTILFPDVIRPLKETERKNLRESIKAHGVTTAVMVDEEDGVIDGINRLEIAAELGLAEVPTQLRPGLTQEQKADIAITVNVVRRHLTHADQQQMQKDRGERIKRAVARHLEGESLRTIAKEEGVSPEQVRQDLKLATAKGLSVEPVGGKVKGRDGKLRSAKKNKPAVVPVPQPTLPPMAPVPEAPAPIPTVIESPPEAQPHDSTVTVTRDSDDDGAENLRRAWERTTQEVRKAFLEKEIPPLVEPDRKGQDEGQADDEAIEHEAPLALTPEEVRRDIRELTGKLAKLTEQGRKAQKRKGDVLVSGLTALRDGVTGLYMSFAWQRGNSG